jgi:hypothetical protein
VRGQGLGLTGSGWMLLRLLLCFVWPQQRCLGLAIAEVSGFMFQEDYSCCVGHPD